MASRDVLEDALVAYPGTIVLVTHDRHVVRTVADAIVDVRGGDATWFDGTYEELEWRREQERRAAEAAAQPERGTRRSGPARSRQAEQAKAQRSAGAKKGASGNSAGEVKELRRELAALEKSLMAAEGTVASLTRQLADPDLYADTDRVAKVVAEHASAKDAAAALFARWEAVGTALETAQAELD
jgi:ATP-binding cassette subfamily F protein 3